MDPGNSTFFTVLVKNLQFHEYDFLRAKPGLSQVFSVTCIKPIAFFPSDSSSSFTITVPCSRKYILIASHIVRNPFSTRWNKRNIHARSEKKQGRSKAQLLLVVSELRSEKKGFPVRVRSLAMCRGGLSAVIARSQKSSNRSKRT